MNAGSGSGILRLARRKIPLLFDSAFLVRHAPLQTSLQRSQFRRRLWKVRGDFLSHFIDLLKGQ
jgi:hypothetical protein